MKLDLDKLESGVQVASRADEWGDMILIEREHAMALIAEVRSLREKWCTVEASELADKLAVAVEQLESFAHRTSYTDEMDAVLDESAETLAKIRGSNE